MNKPIGYVSITGHGTYFKEAISKVEAEMKFGNKPVWRAVVLQDAVPAQPVDVSETGWLIEFRLNNQLLYWSGVLKNVSDDFRNGCLIADMTADAGRAVRFARRDDAQVVLAAMLATNPSPMFRNASELYSVAEHMWPAPRSWPECNK